MRSIDSEAFGLVKSLSPQLVRIASSRLDHVPIDALRHFRRIDTLDLTKNSIGRVQSSSHHAVLPPMLTINLSSNHIDTIDSSAPFWQNCHGYLQQWSQVRRIDLHDNRLEESALRGSQFDRMPALEQLDLSSNLLAAMPDATRHLRSDRHLRALSLRSNAIRVVERTDFVLLTEAVMSGDDFEANPIACNASDNIWFICWVETKILGTNRSTSARCNGDGMTLTQFYRERLGPAVCQRYFPIFDPTTTTAAPDGVGVLLHTWLPVALVAVCIAGLLAVMLFVRFRTHFVREDQLPFGFGQCILSVLYC